MTLTFFVAGRPISQGSKTLGYSARGVPFMREADDKNLRPWRSDIVKVGKLAAGVAKWIIPRDAAVECLFYFTRPKTVTRARPTVKPDLDKLVRAVLDSLVGARILDDDANVTRLVGDKAYGIPGVRITITNREDTLL